MAFTATYFSPFSLATTHNHPYSGLLLLTRLLYLWQHPTNKNISHSYTQSYPHTQVTLNIIQSFTLKKITSLKVLPQFLNELKIKVQRPRHYLKSPISPIILTISSGSPLTVYQSSPMNFWFLKCGGRSLTSRPKLLYLHALTLPYRPRWCHSLQATRPSGYLPLSPPQEG